MMMHWNRRQPFHVFTNKSYRKSNFSHYSRLVIFILRSTTEKTFYSFLSLDIVSDLLNNHASHVLINSLAYRHNFK